jgi:very-short-patch-repair endonuclease
MAVRKTITEFKQWMIDNMPGYECLSSEYVNNKTPVTVRHVECGTVWEPRPDMLLRGRRCPTCHGTRRKSTAQYQAELDEKFGRGEYVVEGEYVDNKTPVALRHTRCNGVWSPLPRDALVVSRTNGCFHCFGTPALSQQAFIAEVQELVGDEYTVLGEYLGRATPILMRHEKCGHEWSIRPGNFVRPYGDRCPACNLGQRVSRGVRLIAHLLEAQGLAFEEEKTFPECRSRRGKLMPFDFFIPELNLAIEYDGPQHFYAMSDRGGQFGFERRQENDADKTVYCQNAGISLVRLSYFREKYIHTDLIEGIQHARNIRQTDQA